MTATIAIVDYGLGNLTSVAGAVERLGFAPRLAAEPAALETADKYILPGVGAFGDGMAELRRRGLADALNRLVLGAGKPILGICLGAQLLARGSAEFGDHRGLGWLDAEVVRIEPTDTNLRVPHVGWNELRRKRDSVLFKNVPDDALFYYVHSFHIRGDDDVITGETDYGGPVTATVEKGRIYGTQFHPEKSQRHGLTVLRNFLEEG